jgi:nitrite reductase/ring-hydroxylating ferredoxin subunit
MKNRHISLDATKFPPGRAATARPQLNLSCGLQKIPHPGFLWRSPRLSSAPQNRAGQPGRGPAGAGAAFDPGWIPVRGGKCDRYSGWRCAVGIGQERWTMAWTRVAALAELKERGVMDGEINGEEIALYWVDDAPYATENICTHAFARLSEGYLDGDCIECPVHQALFNVKTGAAVSPPAYQAVKTYPCRVEGENIMIEV